VRAAKGFGTAKGTTELGPKFCGCDDHGGVQVDGRPVAIYAHSALYARCSTRIERAINVTSLLPQLLHGINTLIIDDFAFWHIP
jgi:hypothetical protein